MTLRGKKYDVSDVTTVAELQERISEASGVDPSQQGRVLFDGQRLDSKAILSDVGVTEGSQLNLVPGSKKKKSSSSSSSSSSSAAAAAAPATASADSAADAASMDPAKLAKDMLESAGIDPSQMEEMAKSMGLGGGEGGAGGMPDMKESLDMMTKMTKSDVFQDYMKDPERLEESRQMILNNPMMKSMMGSMPGE